ncbi:MAG: hypothetical protein B0W54_20870 [Cellvibrio sp. 79]|nr:MAG: hypothetical protein B0W54_20870 [Cellvibrio sp. 79]
MWIRKAPYKIKPPLPEIIRHDQLPPGAIEIANIVEITEGDLIYFIKNNGFLSILSVTEPDRKLANGQPYYRCSQDDFPLEFLSWFPSALIEFQKPPAQGGLHAGAITTSDIEVGGEMLCIQRALGVDQDRGGYIVENNSRCEKDYDPETEFEPHSICWASRFLYEGGLLNLITDLGDKYKTGYL